ncbi:hypothetical protein NDU88_004463 [Pleurodeles waltl]|uniref:Uncharacterized protein n=1 Tax=Pleurodeles waltl TaxID=8319 RepID=A0AAV7NJM8_PLEWA|nr:hypothetical protein NDU88_004463 [Pleurodeles waltl]
MDVAPPHQHHTSTVTEDNGGFPLLVAPEGHCVYGRASKSTEEPPPIDSLTSSGRPGHGLQEMAWTHERSKSSYESPTVMVR